MLGKRICEPAPVYKHYFGNAVGKLNLFFDREILPHKRGIGLRCVTNAGYQLFNCGSDCAEEFFALLDREPALELIKTDIIRLFVGVGISCKAYKGVHRFFKVRSEHRKVAFFLCFVPDCGRIVKQTVEFDVFVHRYSLGLTA